MTIRHLLLSLLIFLVALVQVPGALAHPADLYSHLIDVTLTKDGLSITWEINPGPMLVSAIWFQVDTDKDGVISAEETEMWVHSRATLLNASINGRSLPLQMDRFEFPSSRSGFQAGTEEIKIFFSAAWPQSMGTSYELVLLNEMEERNSVNRYTLHAQDGLKFQTPTQSYGDLTLDIFTPAAQAPANEALLTEWDTSTPSLREAPQSFTTAVPQENTPGFSSFVPSEQNTPQEILLELVNQKDFSIPFYFFALGISLVLGALHALTPGHGKTVVAAYLVGSRGTVRHAVALGTVVTLTHTGSVFLLGLITLLASQYILPTTMILIMEILSGLLIVGLGVYLLWQRYLVWRKSKRIIAKEQSRTFSLKPAQSGIPGGKLRFQAAHLENPHRHVHDHGDGHVHSHDVPETITWRSLVALGISGGLVPCPDAIAILLVATAINRILLGLTLIISFSLGLAVVLIVIGLLMVRSRRLFDRVRVLDRLSHVLPMVSALVVLALGVALTIGAYLRVTAAFAPAGTGSWSIDEAQIVYLAGRQDQNKQLLISDAMRVRPVLLSGPSENVVEFTLSPDRREAVYITQSETAQNKLWLVNMETGARRILSDCVDAICSRPVWSPDGTRIVYEYMRVSGENLTELGTLWWIDILTGDAKPVFPEGQLPGWNPRWSPDGKRLSYATPTEIRFYNLDTGEIDTIPSTTSPAVDWSPDGTQVLYRDVVLKDNQFISQFILYDLPSRTAKTILSDGKYETLFAVWSPDGERLAVVRRALSVPQGDQIWVMRADGNEARMLTNTPDVLHNNLAWSPDAKYLLYDIYQPDSAFLESDIQLIEIDSAIITDLEIKGYRARWRLP
jgi:nickel/cobalt transporter (NicO) family protein